MNYCSIQLAEISLRDLTPFKITVKHYGTQDHSRWVLRDATGGKPNAFFYKIWNPSYVRRDNILAAIASGFYDERTVPALHAVIFHKGLCRGYVMHEGELGPDACDDGFRDLVYSRTRETGYFFVQFGRNHTMIYQGQRSLLDIEAVYPLDALPRLRQYQSHMDDGAYAQYVAGLYRLLPVDSGSTAEASVRSVQMPADDGATMPRSRGAWQRFCIRSSRRIMRRIHNLRPRLDLIQL